MSTDKQYDLILGVIRNYCEWHSNIVRPKQLADEIHEALTKQAARETP